MSDPRDRSSLLRGLAGKGIEIGAFHSPLAVPAEAEVTYVDRFSTDDAARLFQEAASHDSVVRPSVLAPADHLPMFADGSLDFVLASHLLEHLPNPIRALAEWHRILRRGGTLVILLPDCRYTFDWRRSPTTLRHLLEDYEIADGSEVRLLRDRDHYLDFARHVNCLTDPGQARLMADILMADDYPIHFHCFTAESFRSLTEHLRLASAIRFEVQETLSAPCHFEFGFRLTKPHG